MSFDLVLFGGTGDLAWRKLMPALFQAFRHGTLPDGGRIIGVGREALTSDEYRARIQLRFDAVDLAKRPSTEEFTRFAALLEFARMDLSKPDDYATLGSLLKARHADTVVMYVATAPALFTTVCEQLAVAGLNTPNTRVVLEKPLGHDLASNRAINHTVRSIFSEKQVFRIDHYLGKPAVQNLFALRFGNALFEPLWRREHIANIQITIAEELGVEKRGAFYDSTGALRDMVQNHALQLLCAIGMEPPINSHADAIRDEKLKVLRSLKPWTRDTLMQDVIRGQYAAGAVGGTAVKAYREEEGVAPQSNTETFVALRTEISNWRWAGVPFYIRTGKRLAGRDAHIEVNFRPAPHAIFNSQIGAANRLVINLQPKDGLELHLLAQGQDNRRNSQTLAPVQLDLDFDKRFGAERVGAYERLLLDVIDGRLNLFVRSDEQEEAWRWVEPILEHWAADAQGPRLYNAGTWGPSAASAMIARDSYCWSEDLMLDRIRASLSSLAPAEQRVGKLVLNDPRAFTQLPVSELADRSHVSKPTVVRFCRSMGYDGLTDFKRKLAGTVSEGVPFIHRSVDADDKTGDVLVKVIDNAVAAFLKYRNDASTAAIEKAAQALVETYRTGKRIEFFGVGNSGVVAQDAQHKFFRLGINTIAYSDGHMQVMSASILGPGDCVVVISNSGRTRDLMDACDIARKNGATTITITASGSPLAAAGNIHLSADHPEGYDRYSPMVSRLMHLMIIDILATCVALRIGGTTLQPMLQEMKNNLRSKRYA